MFDKFQSIFRIPELKRRILFKVRRSDPSSKKRYKRKKISHCRVRWLSLFSNRRFLRKKKNG